MAVQNSDGVAVSDSSYFLRLGVTSNAGYFRKNSASFASCWLFYSNVFSSLRRSKKQPQTQSK